MRTQLDELVGSALQQGGAVPAFTCYDFTTALAVVAAAEDAGRKAAEHGVRTLEVEVKGPGSGRESALRALQAVGFQITSIRDVTPIPHNCVRPSKRRHV